MMCLGVNHLSLSYLGIVQITKFVDLCLSAKCGVFSHISSSFSPSQAFIPVSVSSVPSSLLLSPYTKYLNLSC